MKLDTKLLSFTFWFKRENLVKDKFNEKIESKFGSLRKHDGRKTSTYNSLYNSIPSKPNKRKIPNSN